MSENLDDIKSLVISDLEASYGGVPVIRNISFSVDQGECFGLMGLNGAGKTTLIKTILSLMDESAGQISVWGAEKNSYNARHEVAYLPERFDPPWFLSGIEFLRFSCKLYKQKISDDILYQSADRLALDRKALKRRVQTYSKGMRQKLGLLGTILTNCKLLILDEPMSGLDPRARSLVKEFLKDVQKNGRTIFLSSHILADMDEICDRVALLHGGTIQYVGTSKKLKADMESEYLEHAFLQFIDKRVSETLGKAA